MALPPPANDHSLYEELRDAERDAQAVRLWKRFGVAVVAGCLLIVLGTALFVFMNNRRAEREMAETRALHSASAALKAGRFDEALADLPPATNTSALSALTRATALEEMKKSGQAIEELRGLLKRSDLDPAMRDLARLRLARLSRDGAEIKQLLADAAAPGAPFAALALQTQIALALSEHRLDDAQAAVAQLQTLPQSESLKARSEELAAAIPAKDKK